MISHNGHDIVIYPDYASESHNNITIPSYLTVRHLTYLHHLVSLLIALLTSIMNIMNVMNMESARSLGSHNTGWDIMKTLSQVYL